MAPSLLKDLRRYRDWLFDTNVNNPLDRLRFYTYLTCTVLTLVGCVLHFFGIMGVGRFVLLVISFVWFCSDAVLLVLFLTRAIGLRKAFTWSAIISQALESARIIYLASTGTISSQQFYINEFICFSILVLVILGFFYKTSLFLTFINLLTLFVSWWFIPDIINSMTISFFILLDVALCSYCFVSVAFVKQIAMENEEVKGKYNSFLAFMRMDDTEVTALIQLVRSAFDDEKHVDMLVGQLKDETKANLLNVATRIKNSKVAKEDKIKEHFPQFSPTELTVCHLVMSGYTQKGIARIMDKTENNVSTVRGNIRRKLNLRTEQDLRGYLVDIVGEDDTF